MSIKIKLRGNGKAIVKFNHPADEQYFAHIMINHRDDGGMHPKIIIRDKEGKKLPAISQKKPIIKKEDNIKSKKIVKADPIIKEGNK